MPQVVSPSTTQSLESQAPKQREIVVFQCQRCFACYIARPCGDVKKLVLKSFCAICGSRRIERMGVMTLEV
jgi:hypothetical protein